MRYVGTVVRGIRTPIIKEDTNLANTVIGSLMKAKESEKFEFRDRDIVAITEAVVGISEGNYVSVALPLRDLKDDLAIFTSSGIGKKISLTELPLQKRAGKGVKSIKLVEGDSVAAAAFISNEDNILVIGDMSSVCISAKDIPLLSRGTSGTQIIKSNHIKSVSKV